MIELNGKYNTAKVFTNIIEQSAISQIVNMMNYKFTEGSVIRIMPDVHEGAGCTIGTTMTITDKIVPNLVGVDIGCGMLCIKLSKNSDIDFDKLDSIIRTHIPSGMSVHYIDTIDKWARLDSMKLIAALKCADSLVNVERLEFSMGTLGGGNHFIEIDRDDEGYFYLVIHTGSRNIGKQVAEFYQKAAVKHIRSNIPKWKEAEIVRQLKSQGRQTEISKALKEFKEQYKEYKSIPEALCYLTGNLFDDYINDMQVCNTYAQKNRFYIAASIKTAMGWDECEWFESVHNYIDTDSMILRKGATDASKGKRVVIPMNMRDGTLICTGKGNKDWNYSAPHGAGRILSRSKAKEMLSLDDYQNEMKNIYTTCVSTSTIDESPMAYKNMQDIIDNIGDTVEVDKIIKPVYNFKASE